MPVTWRPQSRRSATSGAPRSTVALLAWVVAGPALLGSLLLGVQAATRGAGLTAHSVLEQVLGVLAVSLLGVAAALLAARRLGASQEALVVEVAERQRAERELASREAFLSALVECMDVEVVAVDAAGEPVLWNSAARESHALGDTAVPESALEEWAERFTVRSPDGTALSSEQLPISRALAGEHVVGQECVMDAGAGERHLSINARPIVLADGTSAGAVCTGSDFSVLHRREQELARSNRDLDAIARVTHTVLTGSDARQAVVDAGLDIAGALSVILFEPDHTPVRRGEPRPQGDELVAVAQAGAVVPDVRISLQAPSRTATAYLSGRVQQVADVLRDPTVDQELRARFQAAAGPGARELRAAITVPVVHAGQVRAVLSVCLADPLDTANLQVLGLLELLADHAALALAREDLTRELATLAATDPLTGLANRRGWNDRLAEEAERARRTGAPLTVAMLDLDHFKRYNDTRGHQAGDDLLGAVAAHWRQQLRSGDTLARLGGEEFGVLLPECTRQGAQELVSRLLRELPDGQTCSAGTTQHLPGEELTATVDRADQALYRAKRAGRARHTHVPAPEPATGSSVLAFPGVA